MNAINVVAENFTEHVLTYVIDPVSYEIVWESALFSSRFSKKGESVPCYKRIFGSESPCAHCVSFSEDVKSETVESGVASDGARYELTQSMSSDGLRVCLMRDVSEHMSLLNTAVSQISFYKKLFALQNDIIAGHFGVVRDLLLFTADYFKADALLFFSDSPGFGDVIKIAPGSGLSVFPSGECEKEKIRLLCNSKLGSVIPAIPGDIGEIFEIEDAGSALTCRSDSDSERFFMLICNPEWVKTQPDHDDALAIAGIINMSVGNAILQEKIAWSSEHDMLTGLYNRTKFAEITKYISENCSSVGIFFFDVNDLKKYNDEIGHSAGDALLKKMAESMTAVFTGSMSCFRLGGDEFAVLIPDAAPGDLERLCERWQSNLDILNGRPDGITCVAAVGMAYGDDGFTISGVLEIADKRMYEDKKLKKAKKGELPR